MEEIFKKIDANDTRPAREIILEELRAAIFDRKLEAGDRLIENNIAKSMGVSRTPVREALRQLEIEGLAINIARKGTLVKGISKEDIIEIYDIREVLEGLAVRGACLNISRKEILRLKEIIEIMSKCINKNDTDKYIKSHNEYNRIILNASKNKRLISKLEYIYEYLKSMRKVTLSNETRREKALLEHKNIVEAIEEGDEVLAERLARKHVVNAKNSFMSNI
ncbi:GntR family transcriptional regulator [Clostridium tetani]|uniref:Transcriptional regulator, gntR family n=1 Tax=Clostridium tetani (strain Massachusetts / E88) TaxID=212717 RepID=Q891B2_CLOTE|nr:GntR family transcriptional regulator [Clostridium tetani]AAO36933.1 transcriptional regulator, gntR family [Clostridium tetani E88]KGI38625.1 GntR family transcriptional regulator [Clostridium tetani]KGI44132.1 GntR family transcriptional regulator [Clostridium tetani]KHO30943.1 GntR family transcriptional regulator [Clostridium tetani]KIG20943.1 GntR family transcriptional regulator [Clostridium tetani]